MFTWICPKCGRDVPPSYSDCPDCTPKPPKPAAPEPQVTAAVPPPVAAQPEPPPAVAAVPVQAPPITAPPATPTPDHLQSAPWPPPAAPPTNAYLNFPSTFAAAQPPEVTRKGLPGWLIAIGFAAGLAGVLFLLYTYVLPKKSETASATAGTPPAAGTVLPAAAAGAGSKKAHPLAKFLEITGVRFTEDAKQRAKVQFVVVNHSAADLPELKMQIAVKAAGKTVFDFPFSVPSIGPYESKDFSVPVQTSLKGYELPDWQFLKADFEITSEP
jgi:hypothetical protein